MNDILQLFQFGNTANDAANISMISLKIINSQDVRLGDTVLGCLGARESKANVLVFAFVSSGYKILFAFSLA